LYKKAHSHLKVPQVKDTEVEGSIAKEAETECSSKPSPPLSESVASPSNGVSTLSPLQESMLKFATALESGADGYQSLAVEEKLQLLNLLCNDVLSTAYVKILSYPNPELLSRATTSCYSIMSFSLSISGILHNVLAEVYQDSLSIQSLEVDKCLLTWNSKRHCIFVIFI